MDKYLLAGETKYIEFNREYSKTFLKTVSAFANYHNGKIIFGVDDQGNVVGVDDVLGLKLAIEHGINDVLDPVPFFELDVQIIKDKSIVVVHVFKGEFGPYYCSGKAYRRTDTSSVQVDRMTLSELILSGRNIIFEELDCKETNLSFTLLISRMKKMMGISQLSEDMLKTLELIKRNHYTNAALLLSDYNSMTSSKINLIAYEDETVGRIIDRDIVEGVSILEQYEACMRFYKKHLNIGEKIEGPYRETIEELPLVAYRETITNAIVHRDYSRESAIRVEFFNNRVEVVSPGSLPVGLSVEEYREGNISLVRNRIVADIFRRLGIIEKFGTGIRRIREYYQGYQVKPSFKVYDNSVLVILPKVNGVELVLESSENQSIVQMNDREKFIYQLLKNNGRMKRSDIEKKLNLGRSQSGDLLRIMKEKNIIMMIGNGRGTKYCLKE